MGEFDNVFDGFDTPIGDGTISNMTGKNAGKRILVLFIVDATRSMEGAAIGQVNYALAELFSDLKNYASDNMLNMDLAILSFTNSVKWEMKADNINNCYAVPQINVRPGQTQYGVFYNELNKMLNKENLLKAKGKQAAPVIVLLTDGAPTDNYKYDLDLLKKNGYFMLANRSAVLMGEGANSPSARQAVGEFTMDDKMVLTTDNTAEIVNAIKLATLHTIKGTDIEPQNTPAPGTTGNPFDTPAPGPAPDPADPFGLSTPAPGPAPDPADPFGGAPAPGPAPDPADPFGGAPAPGPAPDPADPFGGAPAPGPAPDPADPFGGAPAPGPVPDPADPFGGASAPGPTDDPFAGMPTPGPTDDPFGTAPATGDAGDAFGTQATSTDNPFDGDPFATL